MSQPNYALSWAEERRAEEDGPGQSLCEQHLCHPCSPPIVLFLQAVWWPLPSPTSPFMTDIVMSLEFWAASHWAMQCFSSLRDSGTRSSHHPGHRAINHPAGTGLRFLSSYQFLQGTKRLLWALGSQNFSSLWGSWGLWAMLKKIAGESHTHALSFSFIKYFKSGYD